MRDSDSPSACRADQTFDPVRQARQLAALAREARLLEFALKGNSGVAKRLAADLKEALERAMESDTPAEISDACSALATTLGEVLGSGMQLSAVMTDIEVEGVLGVARMPVLTAVLTSPTA